jgi:hypothetical protein
MLRRRLSTLAKISVHVAQQCAQDSPAVRIVFASQHGELHRTTAMLNDLAIGEALSPTAFSLSVLNATAGVLSILRKDPSPATAISAAENSFGFGLLEAHTQWRDDPSLPVLLIYADEPPPALYPGQRAMPAHAIALLLSGDATDEIECSIGFAPQHENNVEAQSLAFLRCLHSGTDVQWCNQGHAWRWAHRPAIAQ